MDLRAFNLLVGGNGSWRWACNLNTKLDNVIWSLKGLYVGTVATRRQSDSIVPRHGVHRRSELSGVTAGQQRGKRGLYVNPINLGSLRDCEDNYLVHSEAFYYTEG